MRIYRYLDISFWCENKEYDLIPQDIDEDDFEVTIITPARHPNLKRGCVGNLIYNCHKGVDIKTGSDAEGEQQDCLNDVLLKKIQVYDFNEDSVPIWKYVFEKE